MDHSSEAIQTKQEQTSPDKIEPVVVETTTVEEKEVDETDIQVKLMFSKKTTKIDEIFTVNLTLHNVKSMVKILSNFVAFLENINFTS